MVMIPPGEFEEELHQKLTKAYNENYPGYHGNEIAAGMSAHGYLWDLQFPEVRQYLRYILARSDIDWTYVDDRTQD